MAIMGKEWRDLLQLQMWTPLAALSIRTRQLSENIHKVEDGKYIVVVSSDLTGNTERGPYVTMVAWAETDGAALRAIDGALESDRQRRTQARPPAALLPDARALDYASIVASLKKHGEVLMESWGYRIASDGAFLHRAIRSAHATYYFRTVKAIDGEIPFAITHHIAAAP